ncbi:MAG: Slp family lipoprotein [Nitrospirae bacterium]|nr:Slp family lipoprotein [Nitrospirota bacterium]
MNTHASRAVRAALLLALGLSSCAPVLPRDLIRSADRATPLSVVKENPDRYKGKLFVFGGTIVETRVTPEGSLVEALHRPVDAWGYIRRAQRPDGRFLAIYPKEKGLLDPLIYTPGREITVAGTFIGSRPGKIGEIETAFPLFEIKNVHLWAEMETHYPPPYPYWYYPYPYWWDGPMWPYRYPPPHYLAPPPQPRN